MTLLRGAGPLPRILVAAELFLAVGALGGAIGLVSGGIDLGTATDDLPWDSPVLAGIALGLSNALFPLLVAGGEWQRARWAAGGHVLVGIVLVAWMVVQVALIGFGSWLQASYAAFGVAIALVGWWNLRTGGSGRRR